LPTMDFPQDSARRIIKLALEEDCGSGDVTSRLTIPTGHRSRAQILAKEAGRISGLPLLPLVLEELAALVPDSTASEVRFELLVDDGDLVKPGTVIARLLGPTQAILQAERTILNLLQRLSGTATAAARYQAAAGPNCRILDTRKTTPGLRRLEKYAIRCGGGSNHRMGLWDAILIKENHARAAGGVRKAAMAAIAGNTGALPLIVEVSSLEELQTLCDLPLTRVLLDNFSPEDVAQAVSLRKAHMASFALEASGGITIETLPAYASAGAEYVSIGALTHSVKALDLSLLLEEA
jgi:nicotinate-nucleotide pyrophosphorylase (carboxylating)